ncbi:MAG: hypothetical protein JJ975_14640, partial [Bacteroidia bacterium]|nr:hypothetical protein [Bacteroidia bacterium]
MSARTDVMKYFKVQRIIIPLFLGLLVSIYFLFGKSEGQLDDISLRDINWAEGG